MLRDRVLTASLLLLALGGLLFWSSAPVWFGVTILLTGWAAFEWSNLARLKPLGRVAFVVGCIACYGIADQSLVPLDARAAAMLAFISLLFWGLLVPLWLRSGWKVEGAPLALVGFWVLLPTGLALDSLHRLGAVWLILVMAVVWVSDTAAYFSGRRWGRVKLAPSISPGKTWEGVIGAVMGVLLYGMVGILTFPGQSGVGRALQAHWLSWLGLLFVLTILGILGDLYESWIKRCAGVKDSGTLLPGHGGLLDRIDALTSTLPLGLWWVAEHLR